MESENGQLKPPYLPFQTFWNFIKHLAERPLPPRIDRSIMGGRSGTDQANLFTTLKAFGLIDDSNSVTKALTELAVKDDDERRAVLAALVRTYYPEALVVSEQNGTEQQLHEVFRDQYGQTAQETRRKCVTFFLHAIREAGLPTSANFPITRAGSGSPGLPKPKHAARMPGSRTKTSPPPSPPAKPGPGDAFSVVLRSGGRVSVQVSVNLFDLSTDDRDFVIGLVDSLKGYREANPDLPAE